jgi:hypothetical protein
MYNQYIYYFWAVPDYLLVNEWQWIPVRLACSASLSLFGCATSWRWSRLIRLRNSNKVLIAEGSSAVGVVVWPVIHLRKRLLSKKNDLKRRKSLRLKQRWPSFGPLPLVSSSIPPHRCCVPPRPYFLHSTPFHTTSSGSWQWLGVLSWSGAGSGCRRRSVCWRWGVVAGGCSHSQPTLRATARRRGGCASSFCGVLRRVGVIS